MFDHELDPIIDHSWIPSSAWRRFQATDRNSRAQEDSALLDGVPVMLATVFGLNMLLSEPSIDLQMVSELILSDVGATIQILRLVGREYDFAGERPKRMGECIASLDVDTWFGAIAARTYACDKEHSAVSAFWDHSRLVAQYAQLVAESLDGVSSEDAYLVGLLHNIGGIPKILGWPGGESWGINPRALSAIEGTLPFFVLDATRRGKASRYTSVWRFILSAAHELASEAAEYPCLNAPRHAVNRGMGSLEAMPAF